MFDCFIDWLINTKIDYELNLVLVAVSRVRCSWWAVCQPLCEYIYRFGNLFKTILLEGKKSNEEAQQMFAIQLGYANRITLT